MHVLQPILSALQRDQTEDECCISSLTLTSAEVPRHLRQPLRGASMLLGLAPRKPYQWILTQTGTLNSKVKQHLDHMLLPRQNIPGMACMYNC